MRREGDARKFVVHHEGSMKGSNYVKDASRAGY
jgi:hypothetical protein